MSRGLGSLQRRLLAELEHGHEDALELAGRIFSQDVVENSAYVSVCRALRGLVQRKLVVELPFRYRANWRDRPATARKHFALPEEGKREWAATLKKLKDLEPRYE